MYPEEKTCLDRDDGDTDSFDDCRSHDSNDTIMFETSRREVYNGEEEEDDVNLGKRKRKDASNPTSKKTQR
jgi:hypothetical protein